MDELEEWLVTFWRILSRPGPDTFIEVASYAPGKFPSIVVGLVLAAICVYLYSQYIYHGALLLQTLLVLVVGPPISVLAWVGCINLFYARMFHRKRDHFEEMLYVTVAIYLIAAFGNRAVSFIPGAMGNILGWACIAYLIILVIIATQAITKLKLWQASVAVIIGFILSLGLLVCSPLLIFSLYSSVTRAF